MKMPIIRKVVKVGDSKGITIPKSWLDFYEKKAGQEIREVIIEVNHILKVQPFLPQKKEEEIENE